MWQVSGRSDITDFEEIVRLDTEYISEWNIGLDIKILFKTVLAVLKRDVLYVITSWLPHYQLHYSWPITTAIRRIAAQLMFDKCGKYVDIGRKISFSSHFSLGDRSSVGDNTYILGKVSIGNDVMMAANCAFIASNHNTKRLDMSNASKDQVIANIKRIIEKQYMLYSTTFRDGQYTAQRKFDFIKRMRIKVNESYKSIDTIDIEFSINHDSKNNELTLRIKDSGDIESEENKTEYLESDIKELMKPYEEDRKYGKCCFISRGEDR